MLHVMILLTVFWSATEAQAEDLGNLSANPFLHESTANPFGKGSLFAPNWTIELTQEPLSATKARTRSFRLCPGGKPLTLGATPAWFP